ncbi:4-hydroxy-3-methylbut-2-enyl diphosphate reductase [Eoetvoesiella caeni]
MPEGKVAGQGSAEVVLAQPRGFCAGVDRAIDIVERALELHGAPIYVRHEIVHNRYVVQDLKSKGAIFIAELDEAPKGSIVVFSAHGVAQSVRAQAEKMGLRVFDATCPLVTKVHVEVARMREAGREIIMIGHRGHPEVEGTLGQADSGMYLVETIEDVDALQVADPDNLAFVTQTTLSVDDAAAVAHALRTRFPSIVEPKKSDICYATQNRQDAVKVMAPDCDLVLVVGSPNSSNSNRLREVAERKGAAAYLIDDPDMIDAAWLVNAKRIGLTAGASAPEVLVSQVVSRLKELGAASVRTLPGTEENVAFPLPRELSRKRQ